MTDKKTDRNGKPEPEVKPRHRRFSAAEKLRVLAAADACTERGEIGALIRREGNHSSYLSHAQLQRLQPQHRVAAYVHSEKAPGFQSVS